MRGKHLEDVVVPQERYIEAQRYAMQFPEIMSRKVDFLSNDSEEIVRNIKTLYGISNICWLAAALLFHRLVYNIREYEVSNLTFMEYLKMSKERVGIRPQDVSDMLSAARFFLKYYDILVAKGWTPNESPRKLVRGELALELCDYDLSIVTDHLVKDTWIEFKKWYTSLKNKNSVAKVKFENNVIKVNGKKVLTINPEMPEEVQDVIRRHLPELYEDIKKVLSL